MQDNKYVIGQEVWFYEDNVDNKRLYNGYVVSWVLASGRTEYDYVLLTSQNNRITKSESELFPDRDGAANKMQGIILNINCLSRKTQEPVILCMPIIIFYRWQEKSD